MKKQDFKVTFLSDVVLNKTSNTEGKIENLDFITGSVFLGIVAKGKGYDEFEDSFDVFHSGKVRFGEATPFYNEKLCLKVPFCFFNPKLDKEKQEIYNNHFVNYSDQIMKDKQLKQIRSGYMTKDFELFELDYRYTQKSSHDKNLRRSKDSSMFGYNALPKGLIWGFSVKFDDDISVQNIEKIINSLCGLHYLGKSKTAQYSKVLIEKIGNLKEEQKIDIEVKETTYLYVNSSLALFENEMPTFLPSKKSLGLKNGDVDWGKTQIRTKIFTPYNSKRQNKDNARLVIEKGSVIALKNASKEDIEICLNGVGGFLSEGYGEFLINPDFLLKEKSFKFIKSSPKYIKTKSISAKKDENLIEFLQNRKRNKENFIVLGKDVYDFINKNRQSFEKVTSSQWGQIRNMASFINAKKQCVEEIEIFITYGASKEKWEKGEKIFLDKIKDKNTTLDFIKLFAMKMAALKDKK